jgi:hypothetical protein
MKLPQSGHQVVISSTSVVPLSPPPPYSLTASSLLHFQRFILLVSIMSSDEIAFIIHRCNTEIITDIQDKLPLIKIKTFEVKVQAIFNYQNKITTAGFHQQQIMWMLSRLFSTKNQNYFQTIIIIDIEIKSKSKSKSKSSSSLTLINNSNLLIFSSNKFKFKFNINR